MKAKKAKKKVAKKTAKKKIVRKNVKMLKVAKKQSKDIVQVKHPDGGYAKIDRNAGVILKTKKTKFAGLVVARKVDPTLFG